MALVTKNVKRVFNITKSGTTTSLEDPNPDFTPEEVLNFYSNTYPELTTSTVTEPKVISDELVYEFKTTVGTKG